MLQRAETPTPIEGKESRAGNCLRYRRATRWEPGNESRAVLPDLFAEQPFGAKNQNENQHGEGENILVLGAEGAVGGERQIGRSQRFQHAEHHAAQHRARDVADAAEHRRRKSLDRKSTRLNSSHGYISYAVFFFKK